MDQTTLNVLFVAVAILIILIFVGVWRYWEARLNMSEEDEALERRMASLNQEQANRRRDDEIVRLLRGDEQRTVGKRRDDDEW